jgi:hypothetical protein
MLEGSITTSQKSSAGNPFFSSKLTFYGTSKTLKNVNNTFDVDVAQQVVPADGMLRGTLTNDVSDYIDQMMMSVMSSKYPNNDGLAKITATITIVTTVKVWVPSTTTPSVCPDSPGGKKTGSVCTIKGGDRQVVVDGVTQTVHSDCWQYTDTYLVSENTTGTCASLTSNAACTKAVKPALSTLTAPVLIKTTSISARRCIRPRAWSAVASISVSQGTATTPTGRGITGLTLPWPNSLAWPLLLKTSGTRTPPLTSEPLPVRR